MLSVNGIEFINDIAFGNLLETEIGFAQPALQSQQIEWNGQLVDVVADEWIVKFTDGFDTSSVTNDGDSDDSDKSLSARQIGLQNRFLVSGLNLSSGDAGSLADENPEIVSIEPNILFSSWTLLPDDPGFGDYDTDPDPAIVDNENDGLWGLYNEGENLIHSWDTTNQNFTVLPDSAGTPGADIDAVEAWDVTTGSTSVVVGVIDSGIDYTHDDLYLNIWINQGEIPTAFSNVLSDIDGDSLITFRDLNDPANWHSGNTFLQDLNGNGWIDGGDLLGKTDLTDPTVDTTTVWEDGDSDGNGLADDLIGWDFADDDNDPFDMGFHGTHVAGTIGAVGNNGIGVTGVAWDVQIMPLKFFRLGMDSDGNQEIQGPGSAAIGAIDYATNMKANHNVNLVATNNSWGGVVSSLALEQAVADSGEEDILFVAAAGNSTVGFDNDDSPIFPASLALDNVVSVAATDNDDKLASFSHFGETSVDLAAPGVTVLSTFPLVDTEGLLFVEAEEAAKDPPNIVELSTPYRTLRGTSMAAPHVAGVTALMATIEPTATASQLKEALLRGVDHPTESGDLTINKLRDTTVSEGRLNARKSLELIGIDGPILDTFELANGEATITYEDGLVYRSSATDQINLTFTDELLPASGVQSRFEIKASGGDGTFNDGNETSIDLSAAALNQPQADVVQITLATELQPESYQLILLGSSPNPLSDLSGNAIYDGSDHLLMFDIFQAVGEFESNEWVGEATDSGLIGSGTVTLSDPGLVIGDGYHGLRDVDMFSVELTERSSIALDVDSYGNGLDSYLRLFDSSGNEIGANDDSDGSDSSLLVSGLGAGTYFVGVSGFSSALYDPLSRASGGEALQGGQYDLTISVTSNPLASTGIHGQVWHDYNLDHVFVATEPGLEGFTVFLDANSNGTLDSGETSANTAQDGSYEFNGVAPGTHDVIMVVPSGWEQPLAGGAALLTVTVGSGELVADVNFGTRLELGALNDLIVKTSLDQTAIGQGSPAALSLRSALDLSGPYGVQQVTLDSSLFGQTLSLAKGPLVLKSSVNLTGIGAEFFTIDANSNSRVLFVDEGVTSSLSGVTLTHGSSHEGGGIYNLGSLTLSDSAVRGSSVTGNGGGILNRGVLSIVDVVVDGNTATQDGGGIHNEGDLNISRSEVTANQALGENPEAFQFQFGSESLSFTLPDSIAGGGGVSNNGGSLIIEDSLIDSNSAVGEGGGILNLKPTDTVEIKRSVISNNNVSYGVVLGAGFGTFTGGGGIFSIERGFAQEQPTLIVDESEVRNNAALWQIGTNIGTPTGGGIKLWPPIKDINSILYPTGGSVIRNSVISENFAERGGGLLVQVSATALVQNSTLSANEAGYPPSNSSGSPDGGGIHNTGILTIENSTLSENIAARAGGGLAHGNGFGGTFVGRHLTISDNRYTDQGGGPSTQANGEFGGGGVFVAGIRPDGLPGFQLHNSIVADNVAENSLSNPATADFYAIEGSVDLQSSFNLIGISELHEFLNVNGLLLRYDVGIQNGSLGNIVGTATSPIDPHLGTLTSRGGLTETHPLLSGSPAIDSGDPAIAYEPNVSDQRDAPFVRVFDGNGDSTSRIDIGAYEVQQPRVVSVSIGGQNSLDGSHDPVDGFYDIPAGSGAQLWSVPVGGADTISVTFSDNVNVQQSSLTLKGADSGAVYDANSAVFNYDSDTRTASWEFASPFSAEQFVLTIDDSVADSLGNSLDGEWTNPLSVSDTDTSAFPSGDGVVGGEFEFFFTSLPGDLDQNNIVDGDDFNLLAYNFGQGPGLSYTDGDINGDGHVDMYDYNALLANYGVDYSSWSLNAPNVLGVALVGTNLLDGANGTYAVPSGDGTQIATVPLGGADRIEITFSEAVSVTGSELSLVGEHTGTTYSLNFVGIDSANNTAAWELTSGQFPADQLVLTISDSVTDIAGNSLDGEWTNPINVGDTGTAVFPSGNDVAGGDFEFYLTTLPGDFDEDNIVDSDDYSILAFNFGGGPGLSYADGDATGDELVDSQDSDWHSLNFNVDFTTWPVAPPLSASSRTPGDYNADGDADGSDFLTWQQGVGKTYYAHDLVDWNNSYGAPEVASASTDASHRELSASEINNGTLLSAAMAWELATRATEPEIEPINDTVTLDSVFTELADSNRDVGLAPNLDERLPFSGSFTSRAVSSRLWLLDELEEEDFG